jgi:uncharacterized protein YbaR (Trm112 family)
VFIELTDHLRCPRDHEERFLVLLPDRMAGRQVVEGLLGCPVCRLEVRLRDGVVDFGGGAPAAAPTTLAPELVAAGLGIEGPGGFLALIGAAGALVEPLAHHFAGVRFVLVNPANEARDSEIGSVVRAHALPLKGGSIRGAVIGGDAGAERRWVEAALAAVLPGNRLVVEGAPPVPAPAGLDILAEARGLWIGRRAPPSPVR